MKYIAIMDTSILSFNIGDQIIMESARQGLEPITENNFVVNMPTHSPLFHWWEFSLRHNDSFTKNLEKIDLKFVCGTNLLEKDMRKRKNTWNIHQLDSKYIRDFILVGVGTDTLGQLANQYTARLYQSILSKEYIHSTRDEQTKQFLESLGFRAINTGCPTLWQLTREHCASIPVKKSNQVVFTVTDYMPDEKRDRRFIELLRQSYQHIWCWIQGSQDLEYLRRLGVEEGTSGIKLIPPSLRAYDNFLESHDCDYVGTRLHAGIRAMQKKRRAVILGVDNRAYDMHTTYHLNYIGRDEIQRLPELIASDIVTDIHIDKSSIDSFLGQFK